MYIVIAVILVIVWAVSFTAFHVAGALIHLLLLFALISLLIHLFRGRTA